MKESKKRMSQNKASYNYKDRDLLEVFKELQNINSVKDKSFYDNLNSKNNSSDTKATSILYYLLILSIILSIFSFLIFNKNTFASSDAIYEINSNALNIPAIITENAEITRFKEQFIGEYEISFETINNENINLPTGESIVVQEGSNGKGHANVVRTFEGNEIVEEVILSTQTIVEPINKIVDIGKSDFLANQKVHIGDTLYLVQDAFLKSQPYENSEDIGIIKQLLDIKLLSMVDDNWCKIKIYNVEGYIETRYLMSAVLNPELPEMSRIQKILLDVNIDMELNHSSGLTLSDFQKILTGLSQDRNNVFNENYKAFYEADVKYNINGVFLAAIAIHESGWGTSTIAAEKHNLFGFGAYDRSPYESSSSFDGYTDGINTVAKSLVKYYLNPAGTPIYDGETAKGSYYNGNTVQAVNIRYASDQDWYAKVFNYMQLLYGRLR